MENVAPQHSHSNEEKADDLNRREIKLEKEMISFGHQHPAV